MTHEKGLYMLELIPHTDDASRLIKPFLSWNIVRRMLFDLLSCTLQIIHKLVDLPTWPIE